MNNVSTKELKALGFQSYDEYVVHLVAWMRWRELTAQQKADSIAAGSTAFDKTGSGFTPTKS